MKSPVKILVMVVILAGLAGVAYWDDWQTEKDKQVDLANNKVFQLGAQEVKSISFLSTVESLEVRAEKVNGEWWLLAPIKTLADQKVFNNLVKQIVDFKFEKKLSDQSSQRLQEFELDSPVISLVLNEDSGEKLEIGGKSPVGFSRYILTGSEKTVKLAGGHLFTSLNKKLYEFRDKTIGLPSQSQLSELTLINEEEIRFSKDDSNWVLKKGEVSFPLDQDNFSQFMGSWRNNLFEEIIDQPSEELNRAIQLKQSGTTFLASLRWLDTNKQEVVWQFFENNSAVYARKAGQSILYKAMDSVKDQISKSVWDFQYKRVATFDSTEVEKVSIDGESYSKVDGKWQKNDGSSQEFIHSMLIDLEYADAMEIKPSEEFPWNTLTKKYQVTLTLKNSSQIELSFFQNREQPAEIIVRKGDEKQAYIVPDTIIENFENRTLAKSEDEDSQG